MVPRRLGQSGLALSPIGFGAFKIGRNQNIKYEHRYALPSDDEVTQLLNGVLDLGIHFIDTAPAYGLSEERIGRAIASRKSEFVISTKIGETFVDGRSIYDYSESAVRTSIAQSLKRLCLDVIDLVFIHSDGNDLDILLHSEATNTLQALKARGDIRAIGFSGKTVQGAETALQWADAIMVEYHLNDQSHKEVIAEAGRRGVGVVVKKGLASGRLDPLPAIPFVLDNADVTSMVIGGLSFEHIRRNIRLLESA